MNKDRLVIVLKRVLLIAIVPVVLLILIPRDGGDPPGNVKPVGARKLMPDFTLKDMSGSAWQLSSHRGDVVLVNFWASWCSPCRAETPGLIRIAANYGRKGVAIAGISMDEGGVAPVRKFLRDFGVNYPVMMPDSTMLLAREVENLPTTFLIDRQGRIAKTYVGEVRETVFRADIERLLSEPVS
jgi:thiol-disulfide isomerase/thioredoxin